MSEYLLEVKNLHKSFPLTGGVFGRQVGTVSAVSGVSFRIKKGSTLGLVGESGCGKTTLGRSLLRLLEPTEGEVFYEGENILHHPTSRMRALRRKMQIIFQDPYASLNPRMTIHDILAEPMDVHRLHREKSDRKRRLMELLDQVQLPSDVLNKYPHEFSGGQRQRISIARALAVEPSFIVCDEPVSALDVSVQAQVVNLLMDLQKQLGLTYLFISHDLKVVEYISDSVAVMYLGKIVEMAKSSELYGNARHPYTKALFSAIPHHMPGEKKERIYLEGDMPSPVSPPPGCAFHPRCPHASDECSQKYPEASNPTGTHAYHCFNPITLD